MGRDLGASTWPRARSTSRGVSLCSLPLLRRCLPGVDIVARRRLRARRAARACGVGALDFLPEAEYRTELRRSREVVLLSGVRTGRWAEPLEEGSALMARRDGVTTVILVGASAGVRGVDMADEDEAELSLLDSEGIWCFRSEGGSAPKSQSEVLWLLRDVCSMCYAFGVAKSSCLSHQ